MATTAAMVSATAKFGARNRRRPGSGSAVSVGAEASAVSTVSVASGASEVSSALSFSLVGVRSGRFGLFVSFCLRFAPQLDGESPSAGGRGKRLGLSGFGLGLLG